MSKSSFIGTLDIEIYSDKDDGWRQGRYLVHGFDDVLWTDDIESALSYLRESCEQMRASEGQQAKGEGSKLKPWIESQGAKIKESPSPDE